MVGSQNEHYNERLPLNSVSDQQYVLYTRRWYILGLFSFLSANQSNLWITYGAVLDTATKMYGVSEGTINLLAAMGPVGFIPFSFFASWIIGKYGLRSASIAASVLCAGGAVLRCFATGNTFWMVLVGQTLNAIAGTVVMTGPPAISAIWFGVDERTFSTAIGSLANYAGSAAGFCLGLAVHNTHELKRMLYLEAIFTVALMVLFIIYFPSAPPRPPSASASIQREELSLIASWKTQIADSAKVFKSKDGAIILFTAGLSSGVNGAWGAMLVYILGDYYSQWDTQWLGLFNIFAGIAGGLIVGKLHDHYKHYKGIMILFYFLSAAVFAVFSLATQRIIVCSFMEIMLLNVAAGFVINAIYPVSFEALIEVTYPVKEEVSAGLIALMNNFGCLALLIVGYFKTGNFINWVMTGVCAGCCILMVFTKETYKRTKIDLSNG